MGTEPEITPDRIWFNGRGDEGHESFVIERNRTDFAFCKTASKAYDQAVCECLLVLQARIPGFSVRSDGFSGYLEDPVLDEAWPAAMAAVKKYGLNYESFVSNERAPYCDMGMKLRIDGEDGEKVFGSDGQE